MHVFYMESTAYLRSHCPPHLTSFAKPWCNWCLEVACTRQPALERQDLSCIYLAHHELEIVSLVCYCFVSIINSIIVIIFDCRCVLVS